MPVQPNKIRPPVIEDYDDKAARQVRTAVQQMASAISGRIIGRRLLTGTGMYTPTQGTVGVIIEATGAGAGGGGATAGAGQIAAGAGGSSGVFVTLDILGTALITGGPYSCGGGGAGGSGAASGTAGGATTFVINGATYTVPGGAGGGGASGTGTSGNSAITAPSLPSLSTFTTAAYGLGSPGLMIGGIAWLSGSGGSNKFGAGGLMVGGTTAGNAGQGYGGGGSGAAATNSTTVGGAGAAGAIRIFEIG